MLFMHSGEESRLSGNELHAMLFSDSRETRKAAIKQVLLDRNLGMGSESESDSKVLSLL